MFSFQQRYWGSVKSEGTEYSMESGKNKSWRFTPVNAMSLALWLVVVCMNPNFGFQDVTILSPTSHPLHIFHHRRTWIKSLDILWSHREVLLKFWKLENIQLLALLPHDDAHITPTLTQLLIVVDGLSTKSYTVGYRSTTYRAVIDARVRLLANPFVRQSLTLGRLIIVTELTERYTFAIQWTITQLDAN